MTEPKLADRGLNRALDHVAQNDAALGRLSELISIRSISSDPSFSDDCSSCCDHLSAMLTNLGFEVQTIATEGHPVLIAQATGAAGPTCLFYGHYDVQPAGDPDLWGSPPFEMTVTQDRIIGRGACDNKGQLMTFVEALHAWKSATGEFPVNVTFLIEGEEEIGSTNLPSVLRDHADLLQADVAVMCDTSMWDAETPAICTSVRGLMNETVTLKVAEADLHSGAFGGIAPDAAMMLSRALASLTDDDGRVLIPGFYDDVLPTSPETVALWSEYISGSTETIRRLWAEPSLTVTGLAAGHAGPGHQTLIPARARAHISVRLVGGQQPDVIRLAMRDHLNFMLPDGCSFGFEAEASVSACSIPTDQPVLGIVQAALDAEWPNPTRLVGGAGSIPAVGMINNCLGLPPIMVGFGLDDDGAHGPNEKYNLTCFTKGIRSWVRILGALAHSDI